ncbi:CotH kinase family protein [Mucilaginibacter sp. ZT4R22]|uniref:CotH kinase family protein n=1 Tax=Mucilaginibacter pankratovii TaxID=2772110 RepID=A0ABR7WTX5_9SPHI|nr:CotH kinase family protein [Mucilaginibacter pankratovii]MBD1365758.1 CotH kinase family protein [Mucilaginibacter pankratovii]
MKKNLTYLCFVLFIFGCKKDAPRIPLPDTTQDFIFSLEAKNNTGKISENVLIYVNGDKLSGATPEPETDMNFAATFTAKTGAVVKVGSVVQTSAVTVNDFSKPVVYTVTNGNDVKTYTVTISNFTGLPVFTLTTSGPVVSKEDYVTGTLNINTMGLYEQEVKSIPLQMKGRGNSTWDLMPKKSYRLKFDTKNKVLGLASAKNWVLLANYADKTLMRNYLAFALAQGAKSDFAPHGIPVEVILNGDHVGNYTLTEQVEINAARVNIPEPKAGDVSAAAISGGYLIELDQRNGEIVHWPTDKNMPMNLRSPEAPNAQQLNYIKTYLQDTENAIFSADFADPDKGYAKYINVDSFISWFLVNEVFKNQDAQEFSSMFYYKDRGGKLGMGPAWDFDLGAGNVDYSTAVNPEGWWVKNGTWMGRLYQDPVFAAKVKAKWAELKAGPIPAMLQNMDKTEAAFEFSQRKNFSRWNILNIYVWPNPVVLGTYPKEVAHVKEWFTKRIAWLDANIK